MDFVNRLRFSLMYLRRPAWDSGVTPPELLSFLEGRAPGRAIDLGCGTGTNVITLSSFGWQVTGVDLVPAAIEQARMKASQAGVVADFRVGNVTQELHFIPGSFDLALDIGCFHSLSEKGKLNYIRQLDKLLAPHGIWFMYAFLSEHATPGIFASDLDKIRSFFKMIAYKDGVDKKKQPSAYFTLQKT
jgi:SAM-dependent methyltransferase